MEITKDDVGRKVRLRNGDTMMIREFTPCSTFYKVRCGEFSWTQTGKYRTDIPRSEYDIVGFAGEEGVRVLKLTRNDVGKRVRLRNGRVGYVEKWDGSELPALVRIGGANLWYKSNGSCPPGAPGLDIIEFIDEEDQAMWITEDDVGRVVKLRDGRIGQIVEWDGSRYPVCARVGEADLWYKSNGGSCGGSSNLDIVELGAFQELELAAVEKNLAKIVRLKDGKLAVVMTVEDFLSFTSREGLENE